MPAIDVFAKSIKHFKDHFIDALLTRNYNMAYEKNDVTWVLTVPAIWDEPAKQFMQEAAEKVSSVIIFKIQFVHYCQRIYFTVP